MVCNLFVIFLNVCLLALQLLGISVSPGRDQLIVFHSPRENDLVVALQGEDNPLKEDRIGELIALVAKRYFE